MGMTEDIETLAIKVTRLKTEYEQYFANLKKREPLRLREDVEKIIMRYSNVPLTNTALKFKFSSVVSKYIAYKQHWIRVLREIAEGTYHRKPEGVLVRVREIQELHRYEAPVRRIHQRDFLRKIQKGTGKGKTEGNGSARRKGR